MAADVNWLMQLQQSNQRSVMRVKHSNINDTPAPAHDSSSNTHSMSQAITQQHWQYLYHHPVHGQIQH